jgi:tetratricopeptide (TPR) repeat protein
MEAEPNMYKGDWQRVIEVAEEGLPIALEISNWAVAMYVCSWAAQAYLKLNRTNEARRIIDKGFDCLAQAPDYHRPSNIYTLISRGSVLLSEGNIADARADAETGCAQAEDRSLMLEVGAAHRVLGQINAAAGDTDTADTNFRRSLDVLGGIQSQPELAQSLLAYGRFQHEIDRQESMRLLKRALVLFEEIGADGWVVETMAAFRN